jgi:hypothetical protein
MASWETPISWSTASSTGSVAMVKPTGDNFKIAWEWTYLKDINNKK